MSSKFAWTFQGGKLVQAVTSVTLVNNTALTIDITVPTGKRWILLGIKAVNCDDVSRVIVMTKYKESAKTNVVVLYGSPSVAAGAMVVWPATTAASTSRWSASMPGEILEPGNTITVQWVAGGVSAGATDADGLVIEYLEVDI